jgi:hypothetical protein
VNRRVGKDAEVAAANFGIPLTPTLLFEFNTRNQLAFSVTVR